MKRTVIVMFLFIIFAAASMPAQYKPDGQKALETIKFLASDDLQGRRSGTPGYQKAAEYVANKMAEYGLKPGGTDDTFYQQVEFKRWRQFNQPLRLEMLAPRKLIFSPGRDRDFFPNSGTGSGIVTGKPVFVGYGLFSPEQEWDDYAGIDVKGKIVLIIPDAPDFMTAIAKKEKYLETKIKTAIEKEAAGILFMNINNKIRGYGFPPGAKKNTCPEGFVILTANPALLDKIFYTAGSSWRSLVSNTLREKRSYSTELDVSLEMEAHFIQEDRQAPNVLGILPGKHPELKNEYIIIGGHLDHLGISWDGEILNGADDDATGVAVVLEVARSLKRNGFQPDRTIVFAAWAGEELGLIGSKYYNKHPLYPLEKTVVYFNLDMVGTGDSDLYVGGMWEFAGFFEFLKQNMQEKFKQKLNFRIDYRGSDHSSFLTKGVTCISLRTGNVRTGELDDEHPEYHKPGDTSALILPERLQETAEFCYDNIVLLANCREDLLAQDHYIQFLHKSATVVDLHCDTIGRALRGQDLTLDNERGHIDIPKLKLGAVDLQVFACYVGPPRTELQKNQAARRVFDQVDAVHELVFSNPEDLLLITSPDDMRSLRGNRKTGILIGIEGGYAIENDLRLLRSFYRTGARLMTLTHWTHTDWADASGDPEPVSGGLNELGEKIVKEMNRLGMIIDVSHAHDETFWDVINITKAPIVASHSCCRALSEHHRNMSDEMLLALKKNGGMIGINYLPGFLNADNDLKIQELRNRLLKQYALPADRKEFIAADRELRKKFNTEFRTRSQQLRAELPVVDVKTVVDHIEHVIKVTGSKNHIGLGSDFDGIGTTPVGLENTGKISNITAELVKRGYKDTDIKKILGGNFIRIFNRITKVAEKMAKEKS